MQTYENKSYVVKWKGFLYLPHNPCGIPSIEVFCDRLRNTTIPEAVSDLKGAFFVQVFDKRDGATYNFTDNSGMYIAYYTGGLVSPSFLELASVIPITKNDLAIDSIIEYLLYGYLPFGKTFVSKISKLDYGTIIKLQKDDRVEHLAKPLHPMSHELSGNDFIENLKLFFDAIKAENIVIDLTGGFDTRLLVAAAMQHNLEFSVGTSGMSGHSDMKFAQRLANQIGKPHLVYEHDISNLETDIHCILKDSYGELDPLEYHRTYNYVHYRKEKGATMCVSGAGGEMYTDMFWLQDFPFYWSRKSDIDRLYRMRLRPRGMKEHLFQESATQRIREIELRTVKLLKAKYEADRNTRTYDNIRYYYWLQSYGSNFFTMNNNYVYTYSPFMEFTNVNYGYHLPRWTRFFHRFHRKTITAHCRELAKAKTIYGVTASSDWRDLTLDVPRYVGEKVKKYIDWRLQISLGWRAQSQQINDPAIFTKARDLPESRASLALFKELKILKDTVSIDDVPDIQLGRILAIGNGLQSMR